MPSPRTIHQNAIATGSVEPNGSGAPATVAKRIKDEIRFAGAGVAVLIFHRWPREQLGPIRKTCSLTPIDQIAIQRDGQVINGSFRGLLMLAMVTIKSELSVTHSECLDVLRERENDK